MDPKQRPAALPKTPDDVTEWELLCVVPEWMAPKLKVAGNWAYAKFQKMDTRAAWRWLFHHWHIVAAWWITVGIGLTVIFLLFCLALWSNPQLVLDKLMNWGLNSLIEGGKVAGWGSLAFSVLSLPIILPAVVLGGVVAVLLMLLFAVFTPAWVIGSVSFVSVFSLAALRRMFDTSASFILTSLQKDEQKQSLLERTRLALGMGKGLSSTTAGAPRWMDGQELTDAMAKNEATGKGGRVLLGRFADQLVSYRTEKHVFITASSRSGKGRDLIIPNLRIQPHSVFVLDPKGENCNATAALREAMGHRIAVFDPEGQTSYPSATFNPLALVAGDDAVTVADYIAESLIIGKEEDHWTSSARMVIRSMVLHLATVDAGVGRDLVTLRNLLVGAFDATLEQMQENQALDGLVSRLGAGIAKTNEKELASIVSTARRATAWLDNPKLARLFEAGEKCISFDDFRDESKKLSVYVCLSSMVFSTYPQICRLLATSAMDIMMRSLTGRREPVMFILDELAQLDHLPIVKRAFTLGAGFGMQIWAIFQSVEQSKKLYPLDALYGSSGLRLFFKVADPESCGYAASVSSGIASAADVRRMNDLDMLTLIDGQNPLLIQRLGGEMPNTFTS